jgi:hypothetical protein
MSEILIYTDDHKPINVTCVLIKGKPGIRDIYGCQETPDDEDEMEIIEAWTEDGEIELTDKQKDWATEVFWDRLRR